MNIDKINNNLQKFWNDQFNKAKPIAINPSEVTIDNPLDETIKYLGDNAERILDIGTGTGFGLIQAKLLGCKVKYGLGIDTSVNAINIASKTCELSTINGIHFKIGDNSLLDTLDDESFDGIICSNVLDVIPEKTSNDIIRNIKRLTSKNGLVLLKINFFLTDELIEKLNMEKIDDNSYAINNILRGVNYSTQKWIEKFDGFVVVKTDEYDRIKRGPKDRIILLKKHKKN